MSTPTVYFVCHPGGPSGDAIYQHEVICLAQGLEELRVPFYSNVDYWWDPWKKDHLLRAAHDVRPQDCSIVVFNSHAVESGTSVPRWVLSKRRDFVSVFLDSLDGTRTPSWKRHFRPFDLILRSHFNRRIGTPSNMKPWAFGLSAYTIDAMNPSRPLIERKRRILVGYRGDMPVRTAAIEALVHISPEGFDLDRTTDNSPARFSEEVDSLWHQTGGRHDPRFHNRMLDSYAVAAFGGHFLPVWPRHRCPKFGWYQLLNRVDPRPPFIVQWDSWRFWESFAAECLTLHVNLRKYGCHLPEMPRNEKDYVGASLDDPGSIKETLRDPAQCQKIATSGKVWALNHYAPKPTARRFLAACGGPT